MMFPRLVEAIKLAEPDNTEQSLGWYIVADDKALDGPYETNKQARSRTKQLRWYDSTKHDFAHGFVDENDIFHEQDPDVHESVAN